MTNKELSRLILIIGSMLFFLQGDNYATAPVLVDLAREFHLSAGNAALTVTAYMIPFGIFTLIFGPLGDRFSRTSIIKCTTVLTGVFSLVCAFMSSFPAVLFIRFFNGAFASGVLPVSMALIGELAGDDKATLQASLAKTMGLMFLGGAVGPAVGGLLSQIGSWRLVYGFYGGVELALAMVIFFLIPNRPPSKRPFRFLSGYAETIRKPGIYKTLPVIFLTGMAVWGFFPYAGSYLKQYTSLSLPLIGLVLTMYGFGAVSAGRLGGKILQLGETPYFIIACLLGIGSIALFHSRLDVLVMALGLAGFGFSFMMLHPMMVARAQQSHPSARGTVMSLCSLNMSLGGGIGTLLNRSLSQSIGITVISATSIGLFFFATMTALVTSRQLLKASSDLQPG